jgi:uncharacterized protein (DUF302 family)
MEESFTYAGYSRKMDISLRSGIVMQQSLHSVDETVSKLRELLRSRSIMLFAVVDHSGEAEKAGLHMPNTKLLIFGNPKSGTPIMLASPSSALDLPLKILVSEDAAGDVWISYNSPAYLEARHGFPSGLTKLISAVEDLARSAGE